MPASDGHALVMKSTVPCGTGANVKRIFRERDKTGFSYVSCPEFLKEGSAVGDFLHPDRVVVGDDRDWAGDAVVELYRPLLGAEHGGEGPGALVRTDIASAEMVKLASNAFLATKISFINEIANVCEEVGADVVEVAQGMGLDGRIGPKFLQAGLGYGGSCFTKDVSALKLLAGNSGYHFQLLNAVIEVNELQKRRVVSKLQRHLGPLAGKRVALLGLAFKPNTDDMRGASSLVLAARLQAEGAHVRAFDPIAEAEARKLMPQLDYARVGSGRPRRRRRRGARHRVARVPGAGLARGRRGDAREPGDRRSQRPRRRRRARRGARLRRDRTGLMQAVILVGGEGTRLRPLTSTVPKPVVPLVDRPFIVYMLEWLRAHGIEDVIMSCGFLATSVRNVLGDGSGLGIRLRFVEEPDPRGTAGALKFAESMLDERFLLLNGDVLTDLDLTAQLAQHERTGARATLALVPVEDPTAYGLVHLAEDRSVRDFVEKPSSDQIDTNLISAGAYVLEREVLELVPAERAVSIEREVWPLLIGNGLYGYPSESYWLDIGTPERYLQGTFDIIEGRVRTAVGELVGSDYLSVAPDAQVQGRVVPPAVLERGVRVAAGAQVGSLVVLGEGVTIGAGATVERAVVLNGAEIGAGCTLRDCIVAAGCRVGEGTHISGSAVLGEGVTVGAHNMVTRGARIFPGVTLPDGALRFS